MVFAWKAAGLSYNRYLAIASRALRQSLKEDKRVLAARRGQLELRMQKWTDGKASEPVSVAEAQSAAPATTA